MFKRILMLIVLLSAVGLLLTACGEDETPTTFQVDSTKADVDVRSTDQDGTVTFHIYSPSGIGDATIALTAGKMPETILVRLYVDGLEGLELSYGDALITVSAPANGPITEKVRLAGGEADLAPGNPYWIDIQPLPAQEGGLFIGDPMIPASYLITLPEDFHQSQQKNFHLSWIDFYR
jgi:hypothetical protein